MNTTSAIEQDLIDRLAGGAGSGTFEAHVTVAPLDSAERERFRAACAELGVKGMLIELPAGTTPWQPMTASYHRGDLPTVTREVATLVRELCQRGFVVTRVKLEAVVGNLGVPETDEEARALPAGNYFEFHVKVSLPPGIGLTSLGELCAGHQAHLSSNAFRRDADGQTQRFVTLRAYGCGLVRAAARFEALLADLGAGGFALSNRLREYTIYDSNVAVDAGWIDPPGGVGRAGHPDLELEWVPELEGEA